MTALGLSHVGIGVTDLERSVRFYRDLLGFELVTDIEFLEMPSLLRQPDRRERHTYYLRAGDLLLVIGNTTPPEGGPAMLDEIGNHHLSFWVDNIDELHARLVAEGVPCLLEPRTSPASGRFLDREPAGSRSKGAITTAFYSDPDGIIVQLDAHHD